MWSSCDRTGFPLIAIPRLELSVQLLPVTKVQCERFLVEPDTPGDAWYEQVLRLNPRVPHHCLTTDNREGAFLTGALPEEALALARWMGEGFDLPTVEEWRAIHSALAATPIPAARDPAQGESGPAALILEGLTAQLRPKSLLELSLMRGGLVEWARQGSDWVGLGSPRPQFQSNLWEPLSEVVKPVRADLRVPYFGFRLVRRSG